MAAHAFAAATRGDETLVREALLGGNLDVNVREQRGYTLLHLACANGHQQVTRLLLHLGADVNALNPNTGETPLHAACRGAHVKVIELLLREPEIVSSINATTKRARHTPLHCAASSSSPNAAAATARLLANGAFIEARDAEDNTPLSLAARRSGGAGVIQELVNEGAVVTVHDAADISVLQYACASGDEESVKILLRSGAAVDVNRSPSGRTDAALPPLHLAAKSGNAAICQMLLNAGARPDAPSGSGKRAIHLAAHYGHVEAVKVLVKNGAAVNALDVDQHTALSYACHLNHEEVVRELLGLEANPDIPTQQNSWTCLHLAAKEDHRKIIDVLLDHSPRPNIDATDSDGRSAMHWMAFNGNQAGCIRLMRMGARADALDGGKRTAAMVADAKGFSDLAHALYDYSGTSQAAKKGKLSADSLSSYWVTDKASPVCMGCKKRFTVKTRRHHCRECRKLFCKTCCWRRMPGGHRLAGHRVCNACYHKDSLSTSQPAGQRSRPHTMSMTSRTMSNPSASKGAPASRHSSVSSGTSAKPKMPPSQARRATESMKGEARPRPGALSTQQQSNLKHAMERIDRHINYLNGELDRLEQQEQSLAEGGAGRFTAAFLALADVGAEHDTSASLRAENLKKNRYRDILPYDHSRVVLEHTLHDYINANMVDGGQNKKYIVTQGPLQNTTTDFWSMCWQYNTRTIIMIASFEENGRKKCHPYFPSLSMSQRFGPYVVSNVKEEDLGGFVRRTFKLQEGKSKSRTITHFQMTSWPDHGVPSSPDDFLHLVQEFRRAEEVGSGDGLPIIHCSAGVGRSGTFVAVDVINDMLVSAKQHVNIDDVIRKLRHYRKFMVQSVSQYQFTFVAVGSLIQDMMHQLLQQRQSMENMLKAGPTPRNSRTSASSQQGSRSASRNPSSSQSPPPSPLSPSTSSDAFLAYGAPTTAEEEDALLQAALKASLADAQPAKSVGKPPSAQKARPSNPSQTVGAHSTVAGRSADVKAGDTPSQPTFALLYLGSCKASSTDGVSSAQAAAEKLLKMGSIKKPLLLCVTSEGVHMAAPGQATSQLYPFRVIVFVHAAVLQGVTTKDQPVIVLITNHEPSAPRICHCFAAPDPQTAKATAEAITKTFRRSMASIMQASDTNVSNAMPPAENKSHMLRDGDEADQDDEDVRGAQDALEELQTVVKMVSDAAEEHRRRSKQNPFASMVTQASSKGNKPPSNPFQSADGAADANEQHQEQMDLNPFDGVSKGAAEDQSHESLTSSSPSSPSESDAQDKTAVNEQRQQQEKEKEEDDKKQEEKEEDDNKADANDEDGKKKEDGEEEAHHAEQRDIRQEDDGQQNNLRDSPDDATIDDTEGASSEPSTGKPETEAHQVCSFNSAEKHMSTDGTSVDGAAFKGEAVTEDLNEPTSTQGEDHGTAPETSGAADDDVDKSSATADAEAAPVVEDGPSAETSAPTERDNDTTSGASSPADGAVVHTHADTTSGAHPAPSGPDDSKEGLLQPTNMPGQDNDLHAPVNDARVASETRESVSERDSESDLNTQARQDASQQNKEQVQKEQDVSAGAMADADSAIAEALAKVQLAMDGEPVLGSHA